MGNKNKIKSKININLKDWKYSLTSPAMEKAINNSIKRNTPEYDEAVNALNIKDRLKTCRDQLKSIVKLSNLYPDNKNYNISNWFLMRARNDFATSVSFGDYDPIFIDNPSLFKLLATSKIPKNFDLIEYIMDIPHECIPYPQYFAEYTGASVIMLVNDLMEDDYRNGRFTGTANPKWFRSQYILENWEVHICTLAFYVPRNNSKYAIEVQFKFIWDRKLKVVPFRDFQTIRLGDVTAMPYECAFVEALIGETKDKFDVATGILPMDYLNKYLENGVEYNSDQQFEKFHGNHENMVKICYTLAINYMLYKSAYPDMVVEGIPIHKTISPNAKRINVSDDISNSFDKIDREFNLQDYKNKKCPHYRRGHFRVLKSERFTEAKRFKTVWIKPVFIHSKDLNEFSTVKDK